ncbi:DUF835 domain-containing protein [Methanocella sp. MCL-LM]|uniref:DUF835 domain-containing protein n=1 Tax=Methanocella sp. MCL-LM TaxID=3412035 RepID=UPI003C7449AE
MVKILVVEDEHIVAMDLQSRLVSLGYEVPETASSGEEAVEKAGRIRPDLILMDIFLGDEMDGIDAAVKIKELYNIPLIYITAYADPSTLQRAKLTEPFGYILKPFEEREMLTNIEMALYKSRMDSRVKDSERWLATTLKSIGDGVIATDDRGEIKFMNPVAETLTGWMQGAALGRNLADVFRIVSEDTRKPLETAVRGLLLGNETDIPPNVLLIGRDGKETPTYCKAAPIRNEENRITGVVVIFSDITERKRAVETLRRKNRDLEVYNAITTAINRSASIEEMLNEALRESMELLEADFGVLYLFELEGARYAQLAAISAKPGSEKAIRCRQVLHDITVPTGSISAGVPSIFEDSLAATVVPITVKGALIGIMAFHLAAGITVGEDRAAMLTGAGAQIGIAVENHRLFKNVQDTSRYLSDIINESPDAVLTVDMGGFIVSFNKSASRLLKYAPGEVNGRHITSLLPDEAGVDLGENKNYVRDFKCKDGTAITLNISTSTIIRDGRKNGFIVTLKDLSAITGLKITPLMEKAVDTAQRYHFEKGSIYLFDRRAGNQCMEVFADQVKHNIQGLCISRQNPKKIREKYGLEKTPIVWLTGGDDPGGEITMKPDNLTGLGATLGKFLAGTSNGLVLIDGVEYLMTRNGFEAVLKLVQFLNDKIMQSDCVVILCMDPLTLEERQYNLLRTETQEFIG